ncbi:hypothetical protein N7456_007423 [Penicillium angulare]|uniref:Uncharacterized protein n=1 Tax=Penicillium angulare TaxID=116970 RepID=A0A9W9FAM0_9EURO|nr:hypothetical protein N7456_007423 [Penicillium angulare]
MSSHPDPSYGQDTDVPGYWAHLPHQSELPWVHGRRIALREGSTLNLLLQLPSVREPGLRCVQRLETGQQFFNKIGHQVPNIEALLIQSAGTRLEGDERCTFCKGGNGKFDSCVVVPSLGHLISECGNCHWGYKVDRRRHCNARNTVAQLPVSTEPEPELEPGELERRIAEEVQSRRIAQAKGTRAEAEVAKWKRELARHNENIIALMEQKVRFYQREGS